MQYKKSLVAATLTTTTLAAYVPTEPWSTLTPSGTCPGGFSDYATSFGIVVAPVTVTTSLQKRGVISQIGDGQAQAPTATKAVISQITDGQAQAPKGTKAAISQITDGQIQAPHGTTSGKAVTETVNVDITTTVTGTTKTIINQAPAPMATKAAVSQITDGQIQGAKTVAAVSQITDGQIQVPTKAPVPITTGAVSQINDGQIQAPTKAADSAMSSPSGLSSASGNPVKSVSCKADGTLALSIKGGVLTDAKGRIGSIVANRQFQFDGPPPQAGAIYAGGWSITPQGNLALGASDIFYQCQSGDFYNLYDESIAHQCSPVHLQAVDLINC